MPATTISPAGRCPAMTPPNACCGARWRRRCRKSQADLAPNRPRPESLRLLSPDPRGRRHGALGAGGRRRHDQALLSRRWKSALFALGYIAAHSAHSTGIAVDLTLIQRRAPPAPPYRPAARLRPLHRAGGASARPTIAQTWAPASTASTPRAHTASAAITPEQKHWRGVLLGAMRTRGFHNYFREWWHFSYGARGQAYDFPIRAALTSP